MSTTSSTGGPDPIDVRALQREMVQPAISHASAVVKEYLDFPNISTIDSDDPHELRQQLLVLKAKMNEYRNKAEQAAYEVERRHRSNKTPTKQSPGAVITGKIVSPSKRVLTFEQPTPESSPIPLLDAITDLVTAEEAEEGWDLLKDDVKRRGTHTTVGIRLGHNSSAVDLKPLQIQHIIPGSSAHICGLLNRGDEIVAVDGARVSEDNINHAVAAVRGTDIVGTNVALTFQQIGTGRKFDVSLVRGAWGAVERKEKLFILFEEVIKLVKRESPAEDVLKVMHHVVEQAKDNEKARSLQEMKIQNHLRALQSEMHRLLKAAKERCEALLKSYASAVTTLNNQLPELTISLHERVEAYIKDLQAQIQQMHFEKEELQAKVDAAAKWMEAVKGMEALAAFSRRKIKNFEAVHKNKKMMMDSDDEEDASAE